MHRILALVLLLAVAGCDRTYYYGAPTSPTPPPTEPATPVVKPDVVEFRVDGTLQKAVLRINNPLDGLTQVVTDLPYFQTISVTGRDQIFLSLDASAIGVGYLHAAIFVNGFLFREASSTQVNPSVSVIGTYRHGG